MDSEDLNFVVLRGYEGAAVGAWLDWLGERRSEWDILNLNFLRSESPGACALVGELAARPWIHVQRESPHLVIALPNEWSSYLGSLSKNTSGWITRKLRRLERFYSVRLHRCEAEADLPGSLEHLFRLHTLRWRALGEQGAFSLSKRRKFYADVAKQLLKGGWLDFWLLDLDERTVAAQFGFRFGRTHYYLQGGFDPAYSRDSVGSMLRALILRELIREGVRWYDFFGWDEPYKQRWGTEGRAYYHLQSAPAKGWGGLYLSLTRSAERSKEWVRARLPAHTWGLLRNLYRRLRPYPRSGNIE